jgi:maleylacetoacetate isomerase
MSGITSQTTLHGYFRSSAECRVRIALNLKVIAYDSHTYHVRKGDQRTERYLALTPQGLVPTPQTDGALLTQSLAIVEYLEEQWPTPPLLPSSSLDRARVRAMAQIIACDIHPIDNLRVLAYLRDRLGQP